MEDKQKCKHEVVKCVCCGAEGSPAALLAQRRRTVSEAGLEQRREAGKKGGWPKGKPRKMNDPVYSGDFMSN